MVEVPNRERALQGKPAFIEQMEEELTRESTTVPPAMPPPDPGMPVAAPMTRPVRRAYGVPPYGIMGPYSAYPRSLSRGPNYPLPSDLQQRG